MSVGWYRRHDHFAKADDGMNAGFSIPFDGNFECEAVALNLYLRDFTEAQRLDRGEEGQEKRHGTLNTTIILQQDTRLMKTKTVILGNLIDEH